MPPLATTYERVHVRAWACASAAGDALHSWNACRDRRSALLLDPALGWCGRTSASDALALALPVASDAWSRVAGIPGLPAFACASSKGQPHLFAAAMRGSPVSFVKAWPCALDQPIARALGIGCYVPCATVAACSSGLTTVLAACDAIEGGSATHGLVGAVDHALTPLVLAGFAALGVLCGDTVPQAFGQATGFAPAEGTGFFALADTGPWRVRAGVRLGDAGHPTTFTDPQTLRRGLSALWETAPAPELLVTHGTGTELGDAYERAGLDAGPWAGIPRLTCKPIIGHCLGASAAVELALALEAPIRRLWKISLGFGGHFAAIALERTAP